MMRQWEIDAEKKVVEAHVAEIERVCGGSAAEGARATAHPAWHTHDRDVSAYSEFNAGGAHRSLVTTVCPNGRVIHEWDTHLGPI